MNSKNKTVSLKINPFVLKTKSVKQTAKQTAPYRHIRNTVNKNPTSIAFIPLKTAPSISISISQVKEKHSPFLIYAKKVLNLSISVLRAYHSFKFGYVSSGNHNRFTVIKRRNNVSRDFRLKLHYLTDIHHHRFGAPEEIFFA